MSDEQSAAKDRYAGLDPRRWPAWWFGPDGQKAIFHHPDDVPKGWADSPAKVADNQQKSILHELQMSSEPGVKHTHVCWDSPGSVGTVVQKPQMADVEQAQLETGPGMAISYEAAHSPNPVPERRGPGRPRKVIAPT